MRYFLIIILLCVMPMAALAEMKYYPDPVYKKFNDEDASPMADMLDLAKGGDVRAQFIMGDLYSKGKGGVAKDIAEARRWFVESAIHGYAHSFIRLAALAKHENKPAEAWQWYSLAIRNFGSGDDERQYAVRARNELTESAKLSQADIAGARKAMGEWEDMRDKNLHEEKKAALEKARMQKEPQDKQLATAGVTTNE